MLVLSRRVGDHITLPEVGVTIRVLKSKGGRITLGIAAPADQRIVRGELVRRGAASSPAGAAQRRGVAAASA